MDLVNQTTLGNELGYFFLIQWIRNNPEKEWRTELPRYVARILDVDISEATELIEQLRAQFQHLELPPS